MKIDLVLPLDASGKPTLFGIFPQLAVLGDDVAIIKQMLGSSLEKQIVLLTPSQDDESFGCVSFQLGKRPEGFERQRD